MDRGVGILAVALVAAAGWAAERADFVSGIGTEGWTLPGDAYISPTYPNGVRRIEVECTGSAPDGRITVYARTEDGTESQVAEFTAASTGAAFMFGTDAFRSFRLVPSGGMMVSIFTAELFPALRGLAMSTISGGMYEQVFDSLAVATSITGIKDWLNGITLPYWQAWKGVDAITALSYNGGKIRVGGLYALAADINDAGRALGGFSTKESSVSWGIAFTNDTDEAIRIADVTCSAQQWGFANTNTHQLSCSFLVTNRLDWIANFTNGWSVCSEATAQVFDKESAHAVPVVTQMAYSPAVPPCIEPGEVLLLKWSVHPPASGYSAMMAIDDLTVIFTRNPRPFVIHLVEDGQPQKQGY